MSFDKIHAEARISPASNCISHFGTHRRASEDSTIRIWNVTTRECLRVLQEADIVYTVAFSMNGKFMASALESGAIHVRSVKVCKIPTGGAVDSLFFMSVSSSLPWVVSPYCLELYGTTCRAMLRKRRTPCC